MRIAILTLWVALTATTVFAQPPVAWWENPVANGLILSDAQRDRVNVIAREHRDKLIALREEVERAERDLEGVFNADTLDWQRARIVTDALVDARGKLTRDMVRMTLRMRAVLTPEQWKTLQSRTPQEHGRGRGGRGKSGVQPNGRSSQ